MKIVADADFSSEDRPIFSRKVCICQYFHIVGSFSITFESTMVRNCKPKFSMQVKIFAQK